MTTRKGSISVQTHNILPIIKKWLYSEHDIFLRELIANATDAITKRHLIASGKNLEVSPPQILITMNPKDKTIQVSDTGLGMTAEEVEKYIAQVAFSGAQEFVDKMKAQGIENKNDIIGKFGLGFYSCFMVADKVTVDTLSMNEGAHAVHWNCTGTEEYEISESTRTEVGTTITLHLNKDSEEFLDMYKLRSTITRYCDFMPYPIKLQEVEKEISEALNETQPLWNKEPSTLKDEDYKDFYRKLFPMDPEPLFWLHLNIDHPFILKGILYFPKLNPSKPTNDSNIRLYCRQVFVSDNVKSIIPDFLSLLKGVIDSQDIPLNVSRSALQGDPNVRRISNYVVKKVADSLKKLFQTDRAQFEKVWEDIGLFVKYGIISDVKFDELIRDIALFKNAQGKLLTFPEYREAIPTSYQEKLKNKFIYFERGQSDTTLRESFSHENIPVIETDSYVDPHLMQYLEGLGDKNFQFIAGDNAVEEILGNVATTPEDIKIKEMFDQVLKTQDKEKLFEVETKKIQKSKTPAYIKIDHQMKRFQQMTRSMGNTTFSMPLKKTLVVNPDHPLVKNAIKIWEGGKNKLLGERLCHYIQDLATLSAEGLNPEEKEKFVVSSQELMTELSQLAL